MTGHGEPALLAVPLLRHKAHSGSRAVAETCSLLQAAIEGFTGGLDGFIGEFDTPGGCKELPSSPPGELPALSSPPAMKPFWLPTACGLARANQINAQRISTCHDERLALIALFLWLTGSSTEGSALPASTKMGSEYEPLDITSAMDWYEGEGGLLGGNAQACLSEAPFQEDLLHGLEAFQREEQQPIDPSWCSKEFSSSYNMSRGSPSSTMIPTDCAMEGRHPSGGSSLPLLAPAAWQLLIKWPLPGTLPSCQIP